MTQKELVSLLKKVNIDNIIWDWSETKFSFKYEIVLLTEKILKVPRN